MPNIVTPSLLSVFLGENNGPPHAQYLRRCLNDLLRRHVSAHSCIQESRTIDLNVSISARGRNRHIVARPLECDVTVLLSACKKAADARP